MCFLVNKYSQTQVKLVKRALMDFYDGDKLSEAKQQLLSDFSYIKQQQVESDSFPHIPQRRDGDTKVQREVDDMFTMLNTLDDRLLLKKLPVYVTDGPDKMHATRLYEGDFKVLMTILEKMEWKLAMFGSALSAISRDVCALQSQSKSKSTVIGSVGQRDVISKESLAQSVNSMLSLDTITGQQGWPKLHGNAPNVQSTMTSSGDSSGTEPTEHSGGHDVREIPGASQLPMHSETRWSALASTPQGSNRFAALATVTVDSDGNQVITIINLQLYVHS